MEGHSRKHFLSVRIGLDCGKKKKQKQKMKLVGRGRKYGPVRSEENIQFLKVLK